MEEAVDVLMDTGVHEFSVMYVVDGSLKGVTQHHEHHQIYSTLQEEIGARGVSTRTCLGYFQ